MLANGCMGSTFSSIANPILVASVKCHRQLLQEQLYQDKLPWSIIYDRSALLA